MKKEYCEWWDTPIEKVTEGQIRNCKFQNKNCKGCGEKWMKEVEENVSRMECNGRAEQ